MFQVGEAAGSRGGGCGGGRMQFSYVRYNAKSFTAESALFPCTFAHVKCPDGARKYGQGWGAGAGAGVRQRSLKYSSAH